MRMTLLALLAILTLVVKLACGSSSDDKRPMPPQGVICPPEPVDGRMATTEPIPRQPFPTGRKRFLGGDDGTIELGSLSRAKTHSLQRLSRSAV